MQSYYIIIIILRIFAEQWQQTSPFLFSIIQNSPFDHQVNHTLVNPLVWFEEAMNKVKWVWSFWLCFPGDYLTCESDKALDLCQTVKTYKAGTTQLSQFHVGVPKMDLCDFRNSWKVSGKEIGPLRISSFRHWQPTNFLQQNQVFPADVVCGSREKWLWGSCHKSRTSWDHSGVSVGLRGKTVGPRAGQEESLRALSTWLWPWTW